MRAASTGFGIRVADCKIRFPKLERTVKTKALHRTNRLQHPTNQHPAKRRCEQLVAFFGIRVADCKIRFPRLERTVKTKTLHRTNQLRHPTNQHPAKRRCEQSVPFFGVRVEDCKILFPKLEQTVRLKHNVEPTDTNTPQISIQRSEDASSFYRIRCQSHGLQVPFS